MVLGKMSIKLLQKYQAYTILRLLWNFICFYWFIMWYQLMKILELVIVIVKYYVCMNAFYILTFDVWKKLNITPGKLEIIWIVYLSCSWKNFLICGWRWIVICRWKHERTNYACILGIIRTWPHTVESSKHYKTLTQNYDVYVNIFWKILKIFFFCFFVELYLYHTVKKGNLHQWRET